MILNNFIIRMLIVNRSPIFNNFKRKLIQINPFNLNYHLHHQQQQQRYLISIAKRIQDKKIERLQSLRNAILDIYYSDDSNKQQQQNNNKFDWLEVRQKLIERNVHFPTNFEFALLSAFDPILNPDQTKLDQNLFESIAKFVSESKTVQNNKIAATRFCVFLSHYSEYLNSNQLNFIRQTAEFIANDPIQIHPVILDIVQSLSKSSKDNCLIALKLLPKFLQCKDKSFSLKLDLLNILFNDLIQHRLYEELFKFLKNYSNLLKTDLKIVENYLQLIASIRLTKQFTKNNLLEMLEFLGEMFQPIPADSIEILINKILKQKLGYRNISDTRIDPIHCRCNCCGKILPGLSLEEFQQLKSNFKSIIFDRNDQYLITNLNEYQVQLMEFEDKILMLNENDQQDQDQSNWKFPKKPKYDLVVDGLNISYRQSKTLINDRTGLRQFTKIYKIKDLDNQIVHIMERIILQNQFKHLLMIGRSHMKTWFQLQRFCKKHKDKIDLNLLLDGTRDDNYILYAAIQHPSTMILSSDYFRDHRNKFAEWYRNGGNGNYNGNNDNCNPPNLDRLFQRWLKSRQIKVEQSSIIKYPSKFDIKIHLEYSLNDPLPIIHIPIVIKKDQFNNDDHEIGWICVQPNHHQNDDSLD